jgi:2-phospho-L-lactate guanylyltransferase
MKESRTDPARDWCLVIPVKRLEIAKSRLDGDLGAHRADFALAFALDTAAAALRTRGVAEVIVVTDDARVGQAVRGLGAHVVPDRPAAGLNPALSWGARVAEQRRPGAPVGALSGDLPALRPAELSAVLGFAGEPEAEGRPTVVADAAGRGTTLYLAGPGTPFAPAFGAASLAAHLQAGAREFAGEPIPSVRQDVDTIADLRAARALGLGAHTAELVERLHDRQIGA